MANYVEVYVYDPKQGLYSSPIYKCTEIIGPNNTDIKYVCGNCANYLDSIDALKTNHCPGCGFVVYVKNIVSNVGSRTATGAYASNASYQQMLNNSRQRSKPFYYTKYFNQNWYSNPNGGDRLYLHYEHATIGNNLNVTGVLFSSDRNKYHATLRDYETIKTFVNMIKTTIPSTKRTYDPTTEIWIIPTTSYDVLAKLFESNGSNCVVRHDSLEDWLKGVEDSSTKEIPKKPEDFFYNTQQPTITASTWTLDDLEKQLATMLQFTLDEFKLADRRAIMKKASRLHPDFNNGDGSKFSEFTQRYTEYKKLVGA
jgi:DNA-directed RNA polymerase subunit RPC12/RpoP